MTSSIVGIVGTPSQGAYTAANAFQDAFARFRLSHSLPATALALGLILEVGSVSNSKGFQQMLQRNATYGVSETEFLQLLEGALCEPMKSRQGSTLSKLDSGCPAQVVTGLEAARFIPYLESDRANDLVWFKNTRFQAVTQAISERARTRNSATNHASRGTTSLSNRLQETSSPEEKLTIVREAISSRIGELIGLAADDIDAGKSISHYGLDSLTAGELRNWLTRSLGMEVSMIQLLNQGTKIENLAQKVAGLESKA